MSRTDIDRIFDRGISDVERMPRKTLSEAEIAAAAAASKSGAGVFLRSHTKEILLCTISFAAGCLVMFAVLHTAAPKPSEPQGNTEVTEVREVGDEMGDEFGDEMGDDIQGQGVPIPKLSNPTSYVLPPTSKITSYTSQVTNQTSHVIRHTSNDTTSTFPEPVVVKKTIIQRDTVRVREEVVVKDTVYLNE